MQYLFKNKYNIIGFKLASCHTRVEIKDRWKCKADEVDEPEPVFSALPNKKEELIFIRQQSY